MIDSQSGGLSWLRIIIEGVVIVGSILLAFTIDAAWDARQSRARETAYLSGILVELRSDSVDLAERRSTALRSLEVSDWLLELRHDPGSTAPADSLAAWFGRVAFVDNFQVLDHTYREVLAAGGLSLIRDDSVRREISDYYRSIESAEFFTEYYKDEESDYYDLLARRLDPDDFEGITRSELETSRLVPGRLIAQLRSDGEIVNAILMNRHWTALRLEINDRRIVRNNTLAETLRRELAGQ